MTVDKKMKMQKIGIMSMQRIINYGSFLQAFALKELILNNSKGASVEFVDYHVGKPILYDSQESRNILKRKLTKGIEILNLRGSFYQKIQFIFFKQNFPKKYLPVLGITADMNYSPDLDCLFIGSDEVFNCIQKNSNVGYSLELFGKNNHAKKLVSYAASFGNTTLDKLEKYGKNEEVGNLLKNFDYISVRDKNSSYIVEKLIGRTPLFHLDPVLAYDYLKYCPFLSKIKKKEKYLVLYAYSGRIAEYENYWIKQYAKKKRLKIYTIGGIHQCADRFINCSPFQIFSYFRNADEVITDTFHGTIFSIITHRKFATIVRKSSENKYGNEEKLDDLLERVKLKDRIVNNIVDVERINSRDIQYKKVDEIITYERQRTQDYIRKILM